MIKKKKAPGTNAPRVPLAPGQYILHGFLWRWFSWQTAPCLGGAFILFEAVIIHHRHSVPQGDIWQCFWLLWLERWFCWHLVGREARRYHAQHRPLKLKTHWGQCQQLKSRETGLEHVAVYQMIELDNLASYGYFVCKQQKCGYLCKKGNLVEAAEWVTDSSEDLTTNPETGGSQWGSLILPEKCPGPLS